MNLENKFFKYVSVGVLNTIATYLLYLLLLSFSNYTVSYTIAYIGGIALSYLLNLKYVFKEKGSKEKMTIYPLIYLFQYIIGVFILYIAIDKIQIDKEFAPIVVVIITLPLTYILTKKILTGVF